MMLNIATAIVILIAFIATTVLFGLEAPLYFAIGVIGITLSVYSHDPWVIFFGGWIGRFAVILFFICIMYYIKTLSFFPENPLEFKFLFVSLEIMSEQTTKLALLIFR